MTTYIQVTELVKRSTNELTVTLESVSIDLTPKELASQHWLDTGSKITKTYNVKV